MTKEELKAKYGMTTEEIKASFSREVLSNGYASCRYKLVRTDPKASWPSQAACLKFCDDMNLDGIPSHFGGRCSFIGQDAMEVIVYTD